MANRMNAGESSSCSGAGRVTRRPSPPAARNAPRRGRTRLAFSLLEMMLVVVIIGLVAAIAIPRLSRGAAGAADSAVSGNLAVLRDAIDRYSVEHGGSFPTAVNVTNQLAQYSTGAGATQATKDGNYMYGPYVRKVPALPVGNKKGSSGIAAADGTGVGWIYDQTLGNIRANTTTEADSGGNLYSNY